MQLTGPVFTKPASQAGVAEQGGVGLGELASPTSGNGSARQPAGLGNLQSDCVIEI